MDAKKFDSETPWEERTEISKEYADSGLVPDKEIIELKNEPHEHYFIRKSATEIGCRDCYNGWPMLATKFDAVDGKLIPKS